MPDPHDAPVALADFDFDLPRGRIALQPARPRDSARLLHVGGTLADRTVLDLPDLLRPGDLLVFNDTKVIPAALSGRRGAASVSVTLHKAVSADTWRAFAKPGKRLRPGDRIDFAPGFAADVVDKAESGEVTLRFAVGGAKLLAALHRHGAMPLPPYIKRAAANPADAVDYQTVYARREGAVAAPTAGLHFTPRLFSMLARRGIGHAYVTLHVGAGTFLPVKEENVRRHRMHAEWGEVSAEAASAIRAARAAGGRIVPVGTTSLRLLETAARLDGVVRPFTGETDLFILPGYRFRAADLLMTNFHLPKSTLFILVSAFAGLARMKAAYAHAVAAGYRFFSYGDACLLEPAP
jgi:S-adenosylmethionine:tRNA ribosyltransferase-isomerase